VEPRLAPQAPAGAAAAAQLLLVQRQDGSLTIGDTHEYAEPFAFDVTEDAYDTCAAGPSSCPAGRCRRSAAGGPASTVR